MHSYQTEELSKQEQYKLLSSSIVPRAIAWIMTKNPETQTLNLAPFSFFSGASNESPLVSIAIFRDKGKMKDTAVGLLNNKEGVIHVVEEHLLEAMNQTSKRLAPDESEVDLITTELVESQSVSVPGMKEARIRLEVVLHQYVPITGTGDDVVTDMFILKVTDFHFDEAIFDSETKRMKLDEMKLLGRLSGPYYGTNFNQIIHLERP